jgi:hypothetical protein
MNPFSKKINPYGNIEILKKYLNNELNEKIDTKQKKQYNIYLNLGLHNLIGKEIIIHSSRSDISSITNPSSYNTPRLYDEY